jgi:hypothetical protein
MTDVGRGAATVIESTDHVSSSSLVNKSKYHASAIRSLPTHDFSRLPHRVLINSTLWRVCRARAVKALGTSRVPNDLYRAHGLLSGLCRARNLLHPFTIHSPPNPLTPAIKAYRRIPRNTRGQQPLTRSSDRHYIRAKQDPHRAHDHTMKYFQQTVDFDYSWEEVSTSNWRKYGPWNEKTPHVIAVDTLSRSVDPATGIVSSDSFTC